MSKILATSIKLILALGLLTFLVVRALRGSELSQLRLADFNFIFLAIGLLLNLFATLITILRWKFLVEATYEKFSTASSLRVGFIGFMFNLSPVGIVGGDAIKVALLTKKYRISLEKSTASAIVDRAIGLFAMFILGMIVIYAMRFNERPETAAQLATQGLTILTIGALLFFAFALAPTSSKNRRVNIVAKIPFIGSLLAKITEALLLYRARKKVLFLSFLATFIVHGSLAASLYFLAKGIFGLAPSTLDHLILYCAGNIGSLIPLSAGPLEYFLDELYPLFTIVGRANYEIGCGMAIGIAYRLATIAVALIGLIFYLFSPSDVKQTLKNANANVPTKQD